MDIFVTSKNDPVAIRYIGLSLELAIFSVGDFAKYECEFKPEYTSTRHYSAIPRNILHNVVKYYEADGWWYSIIKLEFNENKKDDNNE